MKCAEFETLHDAAIYRRNHGGWLFVDETLRAFWFDAAAYTPGIIMTHRLVRGMSGQLICDNRYLKHAPFKCPLCGQRIDDGKPCGCGAR
jgi:hypothetical protein